MAYPNRDRTILVRYDRLADQGTDRTLATSYELVAITRMSSSRAGTWTAVPLLRPEQRDVDPGLANGQARRTPLLETNAAAHRAVVVVHRVASQIRRGDGPDALTGRQGAAHPVPDDR